MTPPQADLNTVSRLPVTADKNADGVDDVVTEEVLFTVQFSLFIFHIGGWIDIANEQ